MAENKYKAVVITVSDRSFQGEREDLSGPALAQALKEIGISVEAREIVSDDYGSVIEVLRRYVSLPDVHLIVTTGGTGLAPRDITPEATLEVLEKPVPGIAELLRASGAEQTPMSWLSRGTAGVAGGKLMINLPGSPKAMDHSIRALHPILIHALDLIGGDTTH